MVESDAASTQDEPVVGKRRPPRSRRLLSNRLEVVSIREVGVDRKDWGDAGLVST
jgi:hypothetical protein